MNKYLSVYKRDLYLIGVAGGLALLPLFFYLLVTLLFVFSFGPDTAFLSRSASGVFMVGFILSGILSIHRMFHEDARDGVLLRMVFSSISLPCLVLTKIAAHWTGCMLPLLVLTPLLAIMLSYPLHHISWLLLVLFIQSLSFSMIGALGSALSLMARSRAFLLSIILFPLLVPSVIFGSGALLALSSQGSPLSHLYLLLAYSLFLATITPHTAAYAIRRQIC